MTQFYSIFLLVLSMITGPVDERIISSEHLGYDVRYWVHVPNGYESRALPVLFVTDGKWYCESGKILDVSRQLIKEGRVEPHMIVLVDAFDPQDDDLNRRNQQFLCNPEYVSFYREELVPEVRRKYMTSTLQEDTGILGLSFGGLNSMYFALNGHDIFGKIGIQSPAPHPCPDIYEDFEKQPLLRLDIYLSTGTKNDKAAESRRLRRILEGKGYPVKYQEVPEGHNWDNWKPLLDDVLIHFYGQASE